ncbi:MAG: desulfoferrodoxin [Planctomycetota bacterium]
MIEQMQVYKCAHCGNIVEVLHGGGPALECCGVPMEQLDEQTADPETEKHVPVIEKTDDGFRVKVGSVAHPMEPNHYIEWVELSCDCTTSKAYLQPGDAPEAVFSCPNSEECGPVSAREYCNKHGLWTD